MKKYFSGAIAASVVSFLTVSACAKEVDFSEYVSEARTDIFIYSDENIEIKAYSSKKEQPYAADGFVGALNDCLELFVKFSAPQETAEISINNFGGEMSYRAVEGDFYLSLPALLSGGSCDAVVTVDGKVKTYKLLNVKEEGVMTYADALLCVVEREKELFDGLVDRGVFCGEIFVRLLYDEGCYYYVGVCDRDKKLSAFLVEGVRGKIIASKRLEL